MDKFFLKSKTIIGIVLTALVALLPQFGITFTQEDGALISQAWDAIAQACLLVFAGWGRFVGGTKLKLTL